MVLKVGSGVRSFIPLRRANRQPQQEEARVCTTCNYNDSCSYDDDADEDKDEQEQEQEEEEPDHDSAVDVMTKPHGTEKSDGDDGGKHGDDQQNHLLDHHHRHHQHQHHHQSHHQHHHHHDRYHRYHVHDRHAVLLLRNDESNKKQGGHGPWYRHDHQFRGLGV